MGSNKRTLFLWFDWIGFIVLNTILILSRNVKTCLVFFFFFFSDHSLVICSAFITNIKSKSAYWHFNTSLLQDNFFKDVFSFFGNSFVLGKRNLVPYSNGGIMEKKRYSNCAISTLITYLRTFPNQ